MILSILKSWSFQCYHIYKHSNDLVLTLIPALILIWLLFFLRGTWESWLFRCRPIVCIIITVFTFRIIWVHVCLNLLCSFLNSAVLILCWIDLLHLITVHFQFILCIAKVRLSLSLQRVHHHYIIDQICSFYWPTWVDGGPTTLHL